MLRTASGSFVRNAEQAHITHSLPKVKFFKDIIFYYVLYILSFIRFNSRI